MHSSEFSGAPAPNLTSTCHTTAGPDPYKECQFPFNYLNLNYTGCTLVEDTKPWCVTETDEFGTPIQEEGQSFSAWGYCDPSCPIGLPTSWYSQIIAQCSRCQLGCSGSQNFPRSAGSTAMAIIANSNRFLQCTMCIL